MTGSRETNTTTHFLREPLALQMIRDLVVIPNATAGRRTAVWSVGCSTGDEPYGLAMLCRQSGHAVDILASDVNPDALERARRGRYHARNLRHVPTEQREHWFRGTGDAWQIAPELRELVRFRQHDITREPAPRHDIDVVLCRNVMVYFDASQVQRAVSTMVSSLRPGALLVLGASEWLRTDIRVRGLTRLVPMEKAGVIVYQRVDDVPAIGVPRVEPRVEPPRPPAAPAEPAPPAAPRLVHELRSLGDARLDAGRPDEACTWYAKALEHAPLLADLHLRSALCHLHMRDPRLALQSLRRALFLTPQLWQAWLLMADLAHDPIQIRHCLDQARRLLESASQLEEPPELRAFGSHPAVALAAARHRLRSYENE